MSKLSVSPGLFPQGVMSHRQYDSVTFHVWIRHVTCDLINVNESCHLYSLLHLECHFISVSNINLLGLFSTERGYRDRENEIIDWDLRMKKWHSKCNRLYIYIQHSTMGWLQLVGSLKLQVSFAKEHHKTDDILQKRPIILVGCITYGLLAQTVSRYTHWAREM